MQLIIEATLVILAAGLVAYMGRFLNWKGSLAGVSLGYFYYIFGGRLHFAIVLIFLVVGGFSTRFKYRNKYGERGRGVRGWSNVLANGGVAASIAVLTNTFEINNNLGAAMFVGAISAAFTDTMATEVGMLSKSKPVMVTTLKKTEAGSPGAVTILGLIGSLTAPFSIFAVFLILGAGYLSENGVLPWLTLIIITGFTGSLFDSLVGGLLQARYRCFGCGRLVEVRNHCGKPTQYLSGIRYINNDVVNILATIYGAVLAYFLATYLF